MRGNQIEKSKVKEGSIFQCSMVLKPYEIGNHYGFYAELQKKIVVHWFRVRVRVQKKIVVH